MSRFEQLLACFRSGQMSERAMQECMRADTAFAAWIKEMVA